MRLKVSKTKTALDNQIAECQALGARFEKVIQDKELTVERERKLRDRVIKEMQKEL